MAASFDVTGTAKLIRKRTQFHNYDPVLRRKLTKRLKAATEPLKSAIAASARENLPHGGGLAGIVADSKTSTRVTLQGKNTGVRLVTRNPDNITSMDKGRLRHPVFGNQSVWVTQAVKPGWWSEPVGKSRERVKVAVELAVKEMLEELAK